MYLIAHVYMHIYGTGLSVCLIVVTLIKPTKSSLIVHKDQCAHFMWYRHIAIVIVQNVTACRHMHDIMIA